jgi:hypothetical protein
VSLSLCAAALSGCASVSVNYRVLTDSTSSSNPSDPPGTHKLTLSASAVLTPDQVAQPEDIFLYSFPLPPGRYNFVGLDGEIALNSPNAVFNESLISVAANMAGTCPANGSVLPNYPAVYNAFPNLRPLQRFILKDPDAGTSRISIDYTMPVGVPVSDCVVVMLDWEGGSSVFMSADLTLSYTSATTPPAGMLLGNGQEFVFGYDQGARSTTDDSLAFAQETIVPQAGTILGFVGDVSDSTFSAAPPPGQWQAANDIYFVPGGCPSAIPVNSEGTTDEAGDYYAMLPANAQHLLSLPLGGYQTAVAEKFVFQSAKVKVNAGDCLLTMFGLNAPGGGGIDSENQVEAIYLPAS